MVPSVIKNANIIYVITARKRSLGQGNVYTGVCLSTEAGVGFPACITGHMTSESASGGGEYPGGFASRGSLHPKWGLHRGGAWTDPSEIHGILWITVNKRAVRILLECLLVYSRYCIGYKVIYFNCSTFIKSRKLISFTLFISLYFKLIT